MKNCYALADQSAAYGAAREKLLDAELALRDQRERVAELRRALPPGPEMPDYVFREGPADASNNDPARYFDTRLSELFLPGKNTLMLVHFMYGPDWEKGCPLCSMWIDGYNAVTPYLLQHFNLAVTAVADLGRLRDWAAFRGWGNLRMLSAQDNTFAQDFGMTAGATQLSGVSVFQKGDDGKVCHFYTGTMVIGEGEYRGLDLLTPVWNFLDLSPDGRGHWNPGHLD